VTDEETVVLADFGLSRDVLNDIYTMHDNTPIPWRRLAPEVLSAPQKVFSKATDVVSIVHYLTWRFDPKTEADDC